ncbi:MAG TPA: hypothetical protein VNN25_15070 [Thermoanaerobaculia bacterium]|nr:hypothetical protein [Thermoanaerobaculia bacterium]
MSTGYEHNQKNHITFDIIDRHIQSFDLTAHTAPGGVQASRADRLSTTYAVARPILVGLAAIPLIPVAWRAALRVFLTALDEVTATIKPAEVKEAFKAGKDQLAGDPEPGAFVEMEPKLPVG